MSDKCQHENKRFVREVGSQNQPPGEYRFWLEQCQGPSCNVLILCRARVPETEPAVRMAP